MVLIEGKLFENKILESKYPGCGIEIIYSPDRPCVNCVQITEELAIKWRKMLEDSYESNIEFEKLLETMIPPKVD
jgi:hypothetical protein